MSIRLRIVLILAALQLVAAAVIVTGTTVALDRYLMSQLERELRESRLQMGALLNGAPIPAAGPRGASTVARGTYGELRSTDGTVLRSLMFGRSEEAEQSPPTLPTQTNIQRGDPGRYFAARSQDGSFTYWVLLSPTIEQPGQLIVARPLTGVEATRRDALLIVASFSLVVVLATVAAASILVRLGLRPLEQVAETADQIAKGDLRPRLQTGGRRTELTRLSGAFNAMLDEIAASFRRREESEQRLRRFVADASHELRTPLTALQGYAELIAGGTLTSEERALAGFRLSEASSRLGRLVDDLLLLAQLDQEPDLHRMPIDLGEVALAAIDDARVIAPDRPVHADVAPDLVVLGDRDALLRATGNLLSNVRAHTPAGTTAVIRARRIGNLALLEVADDGPGIPAEAQAQLFDRFYRVDKSRSRARGGAGLGLSIVAAIAASHGGSVDVESQPGGGATFRILLPV